MLRNEKPGMPGDELSHAPDFSARKWNAQVHTIELKLPIMSEQQVVNVSDIS